jgi:hypothetical protein
VALRGTTIAAAITYSPGTAHSTLANRHGLFTRHNRGEHDLLERHGLYLGKRQSR